MDKAHTNISQAIRIAQTERRWRPGSAAQHLLKRKARGHLPIGASLDDYDRVIQEVLADTAARVYTYRHQETTYVAVVSIVDDNAWLVMFDLNGWMESAYVIARPKRYLDKSEFELLGLLGELL